MGELASGGGGAATGGRLGGMVVPIAIYLAINAGRSSAPARAWPCPRTRPSRWARWPCRPGGTRPGAHLPASVALVDDVAGIVVIALVYSGHIDLAALGAGVAILGAVMAAAGGCPQWRGLPAAGGGGLDRVL